QVLPLSDAKRNRPPSVSKRVAIEDFSESRNGFAHVSLGVASNLHVGATQHLALDGLGSLVGYRQERGGNSLLLGDEKIPIALMLARFRAIRPQAGGEVGIDLPQRGGQEVWPKPRGDPIAAPDREGRDPGLRIHFVLHRLRHAAEEALAIQVG